MESVDALDGFSPVRLVLFFDPPGNEARPRAALEPVPALGEGFSVNAPIREGGDRLEISPHAQCHRELAESKARWYARGRKHRPPRMLPALDVSDGSCEESGATFGSRIDGRQSVYETLHNRVANRFLQHPECEERDSSRHACTLASTVVVREHLTPRIPAGGDSRCRPNDRRSPAAAHPRAAVWCSAMFGGHCPITIPRSQIQLATLSPATRRKCRVLLVTSVRPNDCACVAMSVSNVPIGSPRLASATATRPNRSEAS